MALDLLIRRLRARRALFHVLRSSAGGVHRESGAGATAGGRQGWVAQAVRSLKRTCVGAAVRFSGLELAALAQLAAEGGRGSLRQRHLMLAKSGLLGATPRHAGVTAVIQRLGLDGHFFVQERVPESPPAPLVN